MASTTVAPRGPLWTLGVPAQWRPRKKSGHLFCKCSVAAARRLATSHRTRERGPKSTLRPGCSRRMMHGGGGAVPFPVGPHPPFGAPARHSTLPSPLSRPTLPGPPFRVLCAPGDNRRLPFDGRRANAAVDDHTSSRGREGHHPRSRHRGGQGPHMTVHDRGEFFSGAHVMAQIMARCNIPRLAPGNVSRSR